MNLDQALATLELTVEQYEALTAEELVALIDDSASLEAVKFLLAERSETL